MTLFPVIYGTKSLTSFEPFLNTENWGTSELEGCGKDAEPARPGEKDQPGKEKQETVAFQRLKNPHGKEAGATSDVRCCSF